MTVTVVTGDGWAGFKGKNCKRHKETFGVMNMFIILIIVESFPIVYKNQNLSNRVF